MGIWVAILSYLGFYESWRKTLFIITGIGLIYLAYLFYIEARARLNKNEVNSKSFIDNV